MQIVDPIDPGLPHPHARSDVARQCGVIGTLRAGDIEVCRDLLHAEDVASAPRDAVGLCTGVSRRPRDLVASMIAGPGKPIAIMPDPARLRGGGGKRRVVVGSAAMLGALGAKSAPRTSGSPPPAC